MANPPSTTGPTSTARRVLVTAVAAVAAVASPLGLAAMTSGSEPPVTGRSLMETELRLVRTQAASEPARFDSNPALGDAVRGVGALRPTIATITDPVATIPLMIQAAATGAVASTTTTTARTATAAPPPTAALPAAVAPAPTAPPASTAGADPNDPATWDRLARCEAGGVWSTDTGNGYYGGLQFSASTWRSVGGTGLPHQHTRETQIEMGQRLQARSGWGQWPHCTKKLGYR